MKECKVRTLVPSAIFSPWYVLTFLPFPLNFSNFQKHKAKLTYIVIVMLEIFILLSEKMIKKKPNMKQKKLIWIIHYPSTNSSHPEVVEVSAPRSGPPRSLSPRPQPLPTPRILVAAATSLTNFLTRYLVRGTDDVDKPVSSIFQLGSKCTASISCFKFQKNDSSLDGLRSDKFEMGLMKD